MSRSETPHDAQDGAATGRLRARHLRWGWWTLALFVALGLVLEALHGLKAGLYLDVTHETRRLMWTLAHAHGALIGLVHIAFAATVRDVTVHAARLGHASRALIGATLLMPTGFLLGGAFLYDGDPGLGVFLVPPGGLLLMLAVGLVAASLGGSHDGSPG